MGIRMPEERVELITKKRIDSLPSASPASSSSSLKPHTVAAGGSDDWPDDPNDNIKHLNKKVSLKIL